MKRVNPIKKYYCYYNSADGKYYVESDCSSKKRSRKKKACCITINYYTNIAYEGGQIAGECGRNKLVEFNFTNDNEV